MKGKAHTTNPSSDVAQTCTNRSASNSSDADSNARIQQLERKLDEERTLFATSVAGLSHRMETMEAEMDRRIEKAVEEKFQQYITSKNIVDQQSSKNVSSDTRSHQDKKTNRFKWKFLEGGSKSDEVDKLKKEIVEVKAEVAEAIGALSLIFATLSSSAKYEKPPSGMTGLGQSPWFLRAVSTEQTDRMREWTKGSNW